MKDLDKKLKEMTFDEVLESDENWQPTENWQPEENLDMTISKAINKRIRTIVLKTLAVVLVVLVAIFLCISPIMNMVYSNPLDIHDNDRTSNTEPTELEKTFSAYMEMNYPYKELDYINVEKHGFARYTLDMNILDQREMVHIGAEPNATLEIARGKVTNSVPAPLVKQLGNFESRSFDRNSTIKDLKELPDSAIVYASVKEKSPVSVQSLMDLEKEGISLHWLRPFTDTNFKDDSDFKGGLRVYCNKPNNGKLRTEMTENQLKKVYIDNLELLEKNQDYLYLNDFVYDNFAFHLSSYDLDGMKKYLKETDGLKTDRYFIKTSKQSMIKFITENPDTFVNVSHVNLTNFNTNLD